MSRRKQYKYDYVQNAHDTVFTLGHRTESLQKLGEFITNVSRKHMMIELGCGYGEYTISLADTYPHASVFGVDVKGDRIYKGLRVAQGLEYCFPQGFCVEQNIRQNVHFIRGMITLDMCRVLPSEVFDEVWITFPDPQPYAPHKRLTHPSFLNEYLRMLKPHGLLHLKTDNYDVYAYSKQMMQQHNVTLCIDTDNLYQSEWYVQNPLLQVCTRYERTFASHGIKYLCAQRAQ